MTRPRPFTVTALLHLAILCVAIGGGLAASPAAAQDSKDPDTYVDPEFRFRVKKVDSRNWKFSTPGKNHGSLRLQLDHLIGGKKDFIRILFNVWDAKTRKTSEKTVFEQYVNSVKEQYSEIREQETRDRDRFGRYPSQSYRAVGRLASDKTEIRHMKVHVFKYRNSIYAVVILHEPGMEKEYAEDLEYIEKNFRAS
jgi:hypothetical protein